MPVNTKPLFLSATLFLAAGSDALAQAQTAVAPGQQARTFAKKITVWAKMEYLLSLPTD